jgi:hypothetical protein
MIEKFKVGDTVWVNPTDAKVSKGKVVSFQKVEPYNPVVEGVTPDGTSFKNAFHPDRINKYHEGKKFKEWRYV